MTSAMLEVKEHIYVIPSNPITLTLDGRPLKNTFHVVCPVCNESLTFETDATEFWGRINVLSVYDVEVTRPYSPEIEAHLTEHRNDHSLSKAIVKQHEFYATYSPGIVERSSEWIPQ